MNTDFQNRCRLRNHPTRKLALTMLAATGLFAATAREAAVQRSSPNPRIIPPHAHYGGLSYGEWLVKFNQWFLSVPAADNPNLLGNEDKLATGQPQHLWFLANTAPVVNRFFTVPAGKALLAMIFGVEWDNFLCTDPDTNLSVDELRAAAASLVDSLSDIRVEVDGVPVQDVTRYRATTPVFSSTLPENNLLQALGCSDALPGTYGPMVADAYFLILPPLPIGEHTIHETAVFHPNPSDPTQEVPVDVLWHINVVPHQK